MKINNSKIILAKFQDLLKGTNGKTKLLADQFCAVLEEIPELISFINEKNKNISKIILEDLSQGMEIKEYNSGNFIKKVFGKIDDFYMILSGKILEFEIKYIRTNMTFKEYILFLTRIYLLKEEHLYKDCIEKNKENFPVATFYNYKKNNCKIENEKNNLESNKDNDINIISLCNDINTINFNYKEELKKIKNNIKKSEWRKEKHKLKNENTNYDIMINSFFELYNHNINVNANFLPNETKYSVLIPLFIKKRILEPISFIGDLNKPQKMKNYKGYICLNQCFVVYLDKNSLNQNRLIYKLSNQTKCDIIMEKLFKSHYIFKNMNIQFLKNNFAKYLEMITLKKNDSLFRQNEPYKGIYIIAKGSFELKTNRTYNELNDLNFTVLHSLDSYPQYVNNIKNDHINNNKSYSFDKREKKKIKNYLFGYYNYNSNKNTIMKSPLFAEKAKEKKDIIFCVYKENDILGLGEVYDSKTKINLFTATCITNEAELFFCPNEILNGIIADDNVLQKFGTIIEEKTNAFVRCISKYKYLFEKKIEYLINERKNKNKFRNEQLKNFEIIYNSFDKKNRRKLMCNSSSEYNILQPDNKNIKISIDENNKNNNLFQKLKEDKNYVSRIHNLFIKTPRENQNLIDSKQNENILVMQGASNDNNKIKISNNRDNPTTLINKFISLNENSKRNHHKKLFLGNRYNQNHKIDMPKASSSFFKDNVEIKQRMAEMSRYYSGKSIERNSKNSIISYIENIYLKNKDSDILENIDNNKPKNKKELIHKIKERCLSANKHDGNGKKRILSQNTKSIKSIYQTIKCEDINKYNKNIRPFSSQNKNMILSQKKLNNNKHKKITINKFLPTSLFPFVSNSNG